MENMYNCHIRNVGGEEPASSSAGATWRPFTLINSFSPSTIFCYMHTPKICIDKPDLN